MKMDFVASLESFGITFDHSIASLLKESRKCAMISHNIIVMELGVTSLTYFQSWTSFF